MSAPTETPPPPDPALVPVSDEVRQRMDAAVARLERLEQRIAGWEARMAALEAEPAPVAHGGPDPRVPDLESRLSRLEARWFERRIAPRLPDPPVIEAEAPPVEAPAPIDARALVYARWSALDVVAGEAVEMSVLTDGFEAGAQVTFTVADLTQPGEPLLRLSRPITDDGGWVRAEWTPPKLPAGRDVRLVSLVVGCGDRQAHAPVLTIRKG